MQSLSLVMSECFLSGHGQGHVSNFYTVDLENFTTASRRYTGDIHNSTVVSLLMTHCLQLNFQLHTIGLVKTCRIRVSALLRGNWQDYYWQDASRGHSAIAELLVYFQKRDWTPLCSLNMVVIITRVKLGLFVQCYRKPHFTNGGKWTLLSQQKCFLSVQNCVVYLQLVSNIREHSVGRSDCEL